MKLFKSIPMIFIILALTGCSNIFQTAIDGLAKNNSSVISPAIGNFLSINGENSIITVIFSKYINKSTVKFTGSMASEASHQWNSDDLVISPDTSWSPSTNGTLNISINDLIGGTVVVNMTFVIVNNVICVRSNGNDANSGTRSSPKQTIQNAIDSIVSGVVLVAEGTYAADYDPGGSNTPVVLLKNDVSIYGGYSASSWDVRNPDTYITLIKDTSTVDASFGNFARALYSPAGITSSTVVDGFYVQGGSGQYSSGIYINNSSVKILNNRINTTKTIRTFYGIAVFGGSAPELDNNRIYTGDNASFNVALYINNSSPTVTNNYIKAGDVSQSKGVYIVSNSSPTIDNNQIYAGDEGNQTYGLHTDQSTPTITNNFISGGNNSTTSSTGIYCDRSSPIIRKNTISSGTSTGGGTYGFLGTSVTDVASLTITLEENTITALAPKSTNSSTGVSIFSNQSYANELTTVIRYNAISGNGGASSYGLQIGAKVAYTIRNNTIYGGSGSNDSRGLQLGPGTITGPRIADNNTIDGGSGGAEEYAVRIEANHNPTLRNNLIFTSGNAATRFGIWEGFSSSTPVEVRNNDIFDAPTALYRLTYFSGSTIYVNCTTIPDMETNIGAYHPSTTHGGNIEEDLSGYFGSEYRFTGNLGSVVFDTSGLILSGLFQDDKDKTTRVGSWTIGAYEYN